MKQPLFTAIEEFDTEKAEDLLRNGADPNEVKNEFLHVRPLHAAIVAVDEGGPIEMINLLIKYGADLDKTYPDIGGGTPLLVALANNLLDIARLLLEAGANPNIMSEEGDLPICWSVENNDIDLAKLLLAKGATKTIDSFTALEGRSALGMAVYRLNVEMVRLLSGAGASLTARDFDRNTARDCLPPLNETNKTAWHEIAAMIDKNHITPLMG